jgi:methylthioribulose-1-phosphate dehydratase
VSAFLAAAEAIAAAGRRLGERGLAPAGAGNYSVRLPDGSIAVTVSGVNKGRMTAEQVMRVAPDGSPLDRRRPSAETLLHCLVYRLDPSAGAVLHTHSVAGVTLSRALTGARWILLEGYEVLKAFPGINTHETGVKIPLVDNSQDMEALAAMLEPLLTSQSRLLPAFYIRGHGLYAWGPTLAAAEDIVEASEYLLACELESLKLERAAR